MSILIVRSGLAALVALVVLSNSACTTLRPTEALPEEIRSRILTGDLLAPGDKIRVITKDGRAHELRVAYVDPDRRIVAGADDAVSIDEIVALEKRELSFVKTGTLVGLVVLGTFGNGCANTCVPGFSASACCP